MLYERWLLELWHGDYAVADEILTEDFAGHWPDREVVGPRGAGRADPQHPRDVRRRWSSSSSSARSHDGDLVAARWTGVGRTEEGEMPLLGNDILRVQDGRFAEYWVASWAGTP